MDQNLSKRVILKRRLWCVDQRNDTTTELPEGSHLRICMDPARWDHGMIYIPPGAKIVPAFTAAEARRRVEHIMECAHVEPLNQAL